MKRQFMFCLLAWGLLLAPGQRCTAQEVASARDELLALVPADAGFCLSLQNLRAESQRWSRSLWLKEFRASSLGQTLKNAPEMQRLTRFHDEFQKRFGVAWHQLRDDIFGDAIVLVYWPAVPDRADQEKGLLLVRARRADLLRQLVDTLNQTQLKNKELKRFEERHHNGVKYYLRVDKRSEHFLLVDGNILAFASKESMVKGIIDRRQEKKLDKGIIVQQMNRAGAGRALAALWINPRAFDAELQQRAKAPGHDSKLLHTFLTYWRPLEAVVLSVSDTDDLEVRLAVQARVHDLPASVQKSFAEPSQPSELWSRFPEGAMLSMARQIDLAKMIQGIGDFLSPEHRQAVLDSLQKYLGTAIKMDLTRDLLPNIGPDWGMFLAMAEDPRQFPDALTALAVKPGAGAVKVDQAVFDGVNVLALLVVLTNRDNLAIDKVRQDGVLVNFLNGPKVFPKGVRPAWALKDGYLVFASSPEAILRFHLRKNAPAPSVNGEVPVLMLSTAELAKMVRANRERVLDHMTETNKNMERGRAGETLADALRIMDLINQVTFLQGSGNGQIIWTVRFRGQAAP